MVETFLLRVPLLTAEPARLHLLVHCCHLLLLLVEKKLQQNNTVIDINQHRSTSGGEPHVLSRVISEGRGEESSSEPGPPERIWFASEVLEDLCSELQIFRASGGHLLMTTQGSCSSTF